MPGGVNSGGLALVEDVGGDYRDVRAVEGMPTGEHFVEDDAKREDIGAGVGRLTLEDLRRHIGGRAGDAARCGDGIQRAGWQVGTAAWQPARDTKIEQLHLVAGPEHDVFRLYVAVQDAALMSRGQGVGALDGNVEESVERHGFTDELAQAGAGNVLHDEQDLVVLVDHVVDAGDVGVIEGGCALAFAQEHGVVVGRESLTP